MPILDFHCHAFPDSVAPKAMAALEGGADWEAQTDGTLSGLMRMMDACGVDWSVVSCIATKPSQAPSILRWCREIRSERIIPFASVHPESPGFREELEAVARAGVKGVKLHALYQDFEVDDPKVFPVYEAVRDLGLILLFHSGYDIAFYRETRASPDRFPVILDTFPDLKMVMAHMGGWKAYDLFVEHMAGRDVYIDTSFTNDYIDPRARDAVLNRHDSQRILFGTDLPWGDVRRQIAYVEDFPLPARAKEGIFYQNARDLLGIDARSASRSKPIPGGGS